MIKNNSIVRVPYLFFRRNHTYTLYIMEFCGSASTSLSISEPVSHAQSTGHGPHGLRQWHVMFVGTSKRPEMEVSIVMGDPQQRMVFVREDQWTSHLEMDDEPGYPYDSGNLQMIFKQHSSNMGHWPMLEPAALTHVGTSSYPNWWVWGLSGRMLPAALGKKGPCNIFTASKNTGRLKNKHSINCCWPWVHHHRTCCCIR